MRHLAAWLFALAALSAAPAASSAQRGRPVILLVHGRGLQDRDSAALHAQWLTALRAGVKTVAPEASIEAADLRVVWYADVLDPRSGAGCDYAPADPRARRDARTDPGLKQVVSFAGGLMNLLASIADDSSIADVRALAADAAFLGEARKRCAAEARLGDAIDRARQEGRPIILVAHSLGALVAYDYLSARTDTGVVRRFITIGSMAGAPDARRLIIGGDSTDAFTVPASVAGWTNIRNRDDALAAPLAIGSDLVTDPPTDEPDPHEMVGYLREPLTAREILGAWCRAATGTRPQGCIGVLSK